MICIAFDSIKMRPIIKHFHFQKGHISSIIIETFSFLNKQNNRNYTKHMLQYRNMQKQLVLITEQTAVFQLLYLTMLW